MTERNQKPRPNTPQPPRDPGRDIDAGRERDSKDREPSRVVDTRPAPAAPPKPKGKP